MKHTEDCKKHPIDQKHICCEDQMCPCDYEEFQRLFTENTQLREALQKIFWILNKGTARLWPENTIKAASDIARDAQPE